jgi:DNA uptake protein ComE-like DNA-binding protein
MPEQKIDLNQASKEDLMSIPGASRSDHRAEGGKGGLNNVDELKEILGFAERCRR